MRSTFVALVIATTLLFTVVLPAEYGVDPTGVGRVLGLTEMGRIKMQLEREAATTASVETAASPTASTVAVQSTQPSGVWRDSMTVSLAPTQGIELKLTMTKGQRAIYEWQATSPDVTYNMHGEPPNAPKGSAHSYDKGVSQSGAGELMAAFDGVHGWFWRNRSDSTITITLKTRGEYLSLKEMK